LATLQQLPLLQHLRASITYKVQQQDGPGGDAPVEDESGPPNLHQLCPRLVTLHLAVHTKSLPWPDNFMLPHAWLSCLLPERLQQLQLCATGVDCAHLTHLSALRHLLMGDDGLQNHLELLGMSSLQQLVLFRSTPFAVDLVPLASKLVGLYGWDLGEGATTLTQLVKLTSLTCTAPTTPGQAQEGVVPVANPLLSLTSLRHIGIVHVEEENSTMLQGLSSLASLLSLDMEGNLGAKVVDPKVGQVTQLTSLQMVTRGIQLDTSKSQMVQQLTLLQRLAIDQVWLETCGGKLGVLQQLTQLVVHQNHLALLQTPAALVALLSPQPASLQHVVYVTRDPCTHDGHGLPSTSRVEVEPSPLPGVRMTFAYRCHPLDQYNMWPGLLCPCLHLPGVMEVLPQVE
jgi:hypothetical protein